MGVDNREIECCCDGSIEDRIVSKGAEEGDLCELCIIGKA